MREIQSLARGLQIVNLLANASKPMSITELANLMDVDKSTASRLVGTLNSYGFVKQDKHSRGYVIGKRLHSIGWQLNKRYAVREFAKPYLADLMQLTGEYAHIGMYSAGHAVITDGVQPDKPLLHVASNTGGLIPLHSTAVGKCLIAFGDFPLPSELAQLTPNTITSQKALQDELARIRQRGFAIDDEENEFGVCCIASPVFDAVGVTVAVMGVSGPTVRIHGERIETLGKLLKEVSSKLSSELGFDDAYPA